MAAGPWTPTNTTRIKILNGSFDFDTHAFKCALFTDASNLSVSSTAYSGVTGEVGTSNTGYTTGGASVTFATLTGTTSVLLKFITNPQWTAGSATITAKYAAVYDVTQGDVVCFCTLNADGSNSITTEGNPLTIDSDGTPYPMMMLT